MSDLDKLCESIGTTGDRLLSPGLEAKLRKDYWDIGYFHTGPPRWSVCIRALYGDLRRNHDPPTAERITWVLFTRLWIDVLQLLVRILLYPILWGCARIERLFAAWQGIRFDCPLCFNSSREPLVHCQKCGQIQGVLRPRITELVFHDCCRCGGDRWWFLGQFYRSRVPGLICSDTLTTAGCKRAMPLQGAAIRHLVVVGTHVRSKHAALARLLSAAGAPGLKPRWSIYQDSRWPISSQEEQLSRLALWKSFSEDTTRFESPGRNWTLARTLVLQQKSRRMLHLHNLAHPWIDSETRLYQQGYSLVVAETWLFVVDFLSLFESHSENLVSPTEVLSRMARVVQKYRRSPPGAALSNRIAVLLPVADVSARRAEASGLPGTFIWTGSQIEQFVKSTAPAFWMVLTTLFRMKHVAYFGGRLSTRDPRDCPQWMLDALSWANV